MAHEIDSATENTIFDLLIRSAGYIFNKSHAVTYTKIAWQCAYVKANYPQEYEED